MGRILLFCSIVFVVWFVVIYFLPSMIISVFKRAVLVKGFGEGPIPPNTLYTQSQEQFADPLHAVGSRLTITGVNRDTIISIGWLDLNKGPLILNVPDMSDRFYSVQFTDPLKNAAFAYIGKRTTGTRANKYYICGPGWKGSLPQGQGASKISSPNNSVLIIGRVLVFDENDLPAAYSLSKQLRLMPLCSVI